MRILCFTLFYFLSFSLCAEPVLKINFNPRTPEFLKKFQEDETRLLSRGPFKHEPLTGQPVREIVLSEDLESLYPLIEKLKVENPQFFISDQEFVLSYVLSRILREQTAAYAKFPWIRRERISFARARLADFAFSYPRLNSRSFYMSQQLANRLGFKLNWRSLTQKIQALFQTNRIQKINLTSGRQVYLNIQNERDLMKGLFTPGNFMIAFWALNELVKQTSSIEELEAAFEMLGIRSDIGGDLVAGAKAEASQIRLGWNYSSASIKERPELVLNDVYVDLKQPGLRLKNLRQRALELAKDLDAEPAYFFDQALSRLGVQLKWSDFEWSLQKLYEKRSYSELDLPPQIAAILEEFKPRDDASLADSFLVFISTREGLDLAALGEILRLRTKLLDAEEALKKVDRVWIDSGYSASELSVYLPKLQDSGLTLNLNAGRFGIRELMSLFTNLHRLIEEAWSQEGLSSFENAFHYLQFNGSLEIDFSYQDYRSRTWSIAKDMRGASDIDRLPLEWEPIKMTWLDGEIPYDEETFQAWAYQHLNRVYIQKIQSKVLRLWGLDFDHRYQIGMDTSDPHFYDEIKPRYEAQKEDRFRQLEVGFSVLQLKLPSGLSRDDVQEVFWEIFMQKEVEAISEAAKVYTDAKSRGLDQTEARKEMQAALENEIRPKVLEDFGRVLKERFGAKEDSRIKHVDVLEGGRESILKAFQKMYISQNRMLTAEGALLGYQNNLNQSQKLLGFPLYHRPFIETADDESSTIEIFAVLIRSYKDLGLTTLYDAQLELEDEIRREKILQVVSETVGRLLSDSIWELRPASSWLRNESSGPQFVQKYLDSENVQKIVTVAAEIEHYRIAQEQLWNSRTWYPRKVEDGGVLGSIPSTLGR